MIPTLPLQPTEQCLYAANGTSIPLLGQVQIQLGVKAAVMPTTVLVSDEIGELILGIDWLTTHNCRWDFGNRSIEVDGCVELLKIQPTFGRVKIHTTEDVHVAAEREILVTSSGMRRCEFRSNLQVDIPSGQGSELSGHRLGPSDSFPRSSGPQSGPSDQESEPSVRHFKQVVLFPRSSVLQDGPSGRRVGPTGSFPRPSGPRGRPSGRRSGPSGHRFGPSGLLSRSSGAPNWPPGQKSEPSVSFSRLSCPRSGLSDRESESSGHRFEPTGSISHLSKPHVGSSIQKSKPLGRRFMRPGSGPRSSDALDIGRRHPVYGLSRPVHFFFRRVRQTGHPVWNRNRSVVAMDHTLKFIVHRNRQAEHPVGGRGRPYQFVVYCGHETDHPTRAQTVMKTLNDDGVSAWYFETT